MIIFRQPDKAKGYWLVFKNEDPIGYVRKLFKGAYVLRAEGRVTHCASLSDARKVLTK